MAKFIAEDKLAAVRRYLSGSESYRTIGASIGATDFMVRAWVMQYEQHGYKAFIKSYTSYSAEFKLDVLKYMNDHGTSPNETAAIFNIPSSGSIRKWRIQYATQGKDALVSKKKGRSTMKEETKKSKPVEKSVEALHAELERLRMENAYLKKLNALVQNKGKSPNKIKRK